MLKLFLCSVNRFGLLLLFCCVSLMAMAQDPSFTQLFNNRVLLNPSFAGLDPGLRTSFAHRNQWRAVAQTMQARLAEQGQEPIAPADYAALLAYLTTHARE